MSIEDWNVQVGGGSFEVCKKCGYRYQPTNEFHGCESQAGGEIRRNRRHG